jgi:hypothetical protein
MEVFRRIEGFRHKKVRKEGVWEKEGNGKESEESLVIGQLHIFSRPLDVWLLLLCFGWAGFSLSGVCAHHGLEIDICLGGRGVGYGGLLYTKLVVRRIKPSFNMSACIS